jgi:predicted RNA-binding Zn-ribbon protein involved in translation (DUF1610 family)
MLYFKCPNCGKDEFFITDYQILNTWLGKISVSDGVAHVLKSQSDLRGYTTITAVCNSCHHNISQFNESFTGFVEYLKKISVLTS